MQQKGAAVSSGGCSTTAATAPRTPETERPVQWRDWSRPGRDGQRRGPGRDRIGTETETESDWWRNGSRPGRDGVTAGRIPERRRTPSAIEEYSSDRSQDSDDGSSVTHRRVWD